MRRSDRIKIQRNSFEILFLGFSILTMSLFFILVVLGKADISDFIKDFVQVNITSSLSIAALVASMGAFRWDHYRKGLTEEGVIEKWERKRIMFAKAKLPLYQVVKLNSTFIIMNIVTLQSATVNIEEISLHYFSIEWKWISLILIFICLIQGVLLIFISMRYMKELIFK